MMEKRVKIIITAVTVLVVGIIYFGAFNEFSSYFSPYRVESSNDTMTVSTINGSTYIYVKGPVFTNVWSESDLANGSTSGRVSFIGPEFRLDPSRADLYSKIIPADNKTVVVYPIFTKSAYRWHGFYDYYNKLCTAKCLETPISGCLPSCAAFEGSNPSNAGAPVSFNAIEVFSLLGYHFISDIDIDKDPNILHNYDKVILLHSEYVTQNEFDAITHHPKVIYLYPNALMAKITANYTKNTIKLIRGHGYPDEKIVNGFNWKFDNTPQEFDGNCFHPKFKKIDNGYQLNCTPERIIYKNAILLEQIARY